MLNLFEIRRPKITACNITGAGGLKPHIPLINVEVSHLFEVVDFGNHL